MASFSFYPFLPPLSTLDILPGNVSSRTASVSGKYEAFMRLQKGAWGGWSPTYREHEDIARPITFPHQPSPDFWFRGWSGSSLTTHGASGLPNFPRGDGWGH
eukprot:763616-Hanusia_phi.AAC.4